MLAGYMYYLTATPEGPMPLITPYLPRSNSGLLNKNICGVLPSDCQYVQFGIGRLWRRDTFHLAFFILIPLAQSVNFFFTSSPVLIAQSLEALIRIDMFSQIFVFESAVTPLLNLSRSMCFCSGSASAHATFNLAES